MDEGIGDLWPGDILIRDDRIAAIGPSGTLGVGNDIAMLIDASASIIIPGLINAHMHTWQTALRGIAANWTLPEYFRKMHAGLATVFGPDDLGIATYVGALNQINCGTTTLADWCHNNPTPAHNDAAIDALHRSGIRAVFFHGTPKPDPKPGEPGFWEIPHPKVELERLAREAIGGRVGLAAAILGPHYSTMEVARHDFEMARELNLIASMHQGGGAARTPDGWQRLEALGLLGTHTNIVHGQGLTDEQLRRLVGLGISFSITPESEMTQGHGDPITPRLLQLGAAPSLGIDLESVHSGEMLFASRIALAAARAFNNARYREAHGVIPPTATVSARQALAWVTIEGARMLGMGHLIGTLAPGKKADLVRIDAGRINMQPVHDPLASVVFQAGLANIDAVMIDGIWEKFDGRLVVDARPRELGKSIESLTASGERIAQALGLSPQLPV